MKFKEYWESLSSTEKQELADDCKTSKEYLRHIYRGHRNAGIKTISALLQARPKDIKLDWFFETA
tara:strand:+ start:265 stop:459 length:195 start_codon:yes stop_codon:yes gene_type:complete